MAADSEDQRLRRVVAAYVYAMKEVIDAGFLEEIQWQQSRAIAAITEPEFLRQFAWVVLASGMKESVIRERFPRICTAFLGFESARTVHEHQVQCRTSALAVFAHEGKVDAIISAAAKIALEGFDSIAARVQSLGTDYIRSFPFMGPATSFHLAKNLGLDVVKPDRHLLRIASAAGYETPMELCQNVADFVGDRVGVVDLVLWRYATLSSDHLDKLIRFLRPMYSDRLAA
jgi:hypothetical protein